MAASDVFENFLEPSPREGPKRPIEEFELRERLGGDIALDFDVRTVREQKIGHPAQNLALVLVGKEFVIALERDFVIDRPDDERELVSAVAPEPAIPALLAAA